MDKAIKVLEQKRKEWAVRAEWHRRESMRQHIKGDYSKRNEEQELGKLAIDNIHGLDYAIALLTTEKGV